MWSVGGQKVMEAQETLNSLKQSNKYHKRTTDEWKPEKCDPEVQAEVRRLFSASLYRGSWDAMRDLDKLNLD